MRTRDGVRLDADVYRPDGGGDYPVLLMRQPYGRAIASTVVYAHPTWYARHGYIVVVQDVRGRGTSEGEFDLLAREREDGFDAVEWAARLPGSTGEVGMYGFSYQGMTQLLAAAASPPALKAICPAMAPHDVHADMAYENGAFRLESAMGWAIQLAAETARRRGDVRGHQALYAASRHLPLLDSLPARPGVLREFAAYAHYDAWLAHPAPDAYWDRISPASLMLATDLPALHIGGWHDAFLPGTLRCYREMAARSRCPQRLVVGPWAHIPWSRQVGALDFGAAAESAIDALQVRWFDHWLKRVDTGLLEEPPVRLFEMGGGRWRGFDAWPTPPPRALYLQSTGRAAVTCGDGTLGEAAAGEMVEDVIAHDPWRPAPTLGGHLGSPPGPVDRAAVDARGDVLTYTTAPMERDLGLAGDVALDLWCEADAPSFDVDAVLSEARPDGRVLTISQAHARIDAGTATAPLRLSLRATCARIPRGHALRLSLAGASFPAYAPNPGSGAPAGDARAIDARIITITVSSGGAAPSRLLLTEVDG
jgi:putative CocE/NonD family hydrolase